MNRQDRWKATHRVLADSREAILVLDANNVVQFANPAAESLFDGRLSAGTSFGAPVMADGTQELVVPTRTNAMATVEMRVAESSWDGKPARVISLHDVTERINSQKRIDHLIRVLRAIRNVNQIIVREQDAQKLIDLACETLVETRGYNGAFLALGDGTSPVEALAGVGWESHFAGFTRNLQQGQWPRCMQIALESEGCLAVADPASTCTGCPLSDLDYGRSSLVVALRHAGAIFGLLGVYLPAEFTADDEERSLVAEVADDLAFALHDIQTEGRRAQAVTETAALLAANRAVLESDHFGAVAERLFGICKEQTGATAGYLALRQGGDENSVVFLDAGGYDCAVDPSLPMPIRGLRAQAYRENRTVFDNSFHSSPHVALLPEGHAPLRNVMFVPIALEGEVRGIIGLANKEGHFDGEDARRAQALGEVAAIALQRSQYLEALEGSKAQHEHAQAVAHIGHWELTSYDGAPRWSDEIFRIFGLDPREAEPSFAAHRDMLHPEDWPVLAEAVRAGFDHASPFCLTFRILRSAGEVRWMQAIGRPETDTTGRTVRLFGTAQDVTELCRAQQERDEANRRLILALQSANIGLWDYYPLEHRTVFSDQWKRQLGYEPEELPDELEVWLARLHPEDRDRVLGHMMAHTDGTGFAEYEMEGRLRHRDGTYRWMTARGRAVDFEGGKVSRLIGCQIDITERVAAEQKLKGNEARYRELYDEAPTPYFTIRPADGSITDCNQTAGKLLGCDVATLKTKRVSDLFADTSSGRGCAEEFLQRLRAGEAILDAELRMQRLTGGSVDVSVSVYPKRDDSGQVIESRSIAIDISERRRLQDQLAQADRLASVGLLAAGVAHEINNPLTYVLYNLETLAEELPQLVEAFGKAGAALAEHLGPEKASQVLFSRTEHGPVTSADLTRAKELGQRANDAVEGAIRVRDIVRDLKTFSRVEDEHLVPVSLSRVMESALNMAFMEIKYRARVVKEYSAVPPVHASDGRLAQVFLNLIVNAAQAIDEGNVEQNEIRLKTWAEDGFVMAQVSDTGKGIPPQDLDKIYDAFFTTKAMGVGSGLGLSICRNIVEAHGGTIEAHSELGKGTCFTIRLPIEPSREGDRPRLAEGIPEGHEPPPRGRILVVDDERQICDAVARILGDKHDVKVAFSGKEGRAILENEQEFDLVLCDLMMPDMTGMDLHAWLAEHHPALAKRMVFVTGGAYSPSARDFLKRVDNVRLEKPVDSKNLRALLNNMVDADG